VGGRIDPVLAGGRLIARSIDCIHTESARIMTARTLLHTVPALEVTEGAGVNVYRTIGTPGLRHLDPFLMLDHFGSHDPDDYIAGFPEHPHRGFTTLTYMLDGHMEHRDSLGNRGDLQAGGMQWMKAASGVIHSEMPRQTAGLMRGFQLWINLPAAEKMSTPAYCDFAAERIPDVTLPGARVRLLAGECAGMQGALSDLQPGLGYCDVTLVAHAAFTQPLPETDTAFVYVFEGDAHIVGTPLPTHTLGVLGAGSEVTVQAGADGARFILVSGQPLGEPIVQYGPFVMNTREEIEQAFADYRAGRLIQR